MPRQGEEISVFLFNEIRVQIREPDARTQQRMSEEGGAMGTNPFPYWARLWPAAIGLAEVIADNPHLVRGKSVLELAAGLGLPGILAAHFATDVIISDYAAEAVAFMQSSVVLNGLDNIRCMQIDWNAVPPGITPDVILLSDVNYEPAAFEALYELLIDFLSKGVTILLASPQRLMAKPFIERLMPYCLSQEERSVARNNEQTFISVFILSGND